MNLAMPQREILTGAATMAVIALLLAMVFSSKGEAARRGYDVTARFEHADGIVPGSEVRLAGVSVGRIVGQSLDERYRAVVTMRLRPDLKLSDDTAASIRTDGLLGAKFVDLQPGAADATIPPDGEIAFTQDAMALQDLLEMIIAQAKSNRAAEAEPAIEPGAGR